MGGGELVELSGDLGGGKTTFTQGLAKGLGSKDIVNSPTFTLSRIYKARGDIEIHHFDFYRLNEPGVLQDQLAESLADNKAVTVIEWSGIVEEVLPNERISIEFKPTATNPDERLVNFKYAAEFADIIKNVQTDWGQIRP